MAILPRDHERIRALVALAADVRTPQHEAMAAAMQACRRIAASGLLENSDAPQPQSHAPLPKNFAIDIALLLVGENAHAYRFARVTLETRRMGAKTLGRWLPKPWVHQIHWATEEEITRVLRLKGAQKVTTRLELHSEAKEWARGIVSGIG